MKLAEAFFVEFRNGQLQRSAGNRRDALQAEGSSLECPLHVNPSLGRTLKIDHISIHLTLVSNILFAYKTTVVPFQAKG